MARRSSGRRTDYNWNAFQGEVTAIDLAVGSDGLGTTSFSFGNAGTLTRMRGFWTAELDAAAGSAENCLIRAGIMKVSSNAATAGIGSVPNPFDDPQEDWIWVGHLYVSTGSAFSGASTFDHEVATEVIDSKAMRKVKISENLVFVASVVVSDDATGTVDLKYSVRLLQGN